MRKYSVYLLLILFTQIFLPACEEGGDNNINTPQDFIKYTVPAGDHVCSPHPAPPEKFTGNKFEVQLKIDTSFLYTDTTSYTSKVTGFYEDDVHQNSARISWYCKPGTVQSHTSDSVHFIAYVYKQGTVINPYGKLKSYSKQQIIQLMTDNTAINCTIEISANKYTYKFDDAPDVIMDRGSTINTNAEKRLCYLYYGGDATALHETTVQVKYITTISD